MKKVQLKARLFDLTQCFGVNRNKDTIVGVDVDDVSDYFLEERDRQLVTVDPVADTYRVDYFYAESEDTVLNEKYQTFKVVRDGNKLRYTTGTDLLDNAPMAYYRKLLQLRFDKCTCFINHRAIICQDGFYTLINDYGFSYGYESLQKFIAENNPLLFYSLIY